MENGVLNVTIKNFKNIEDLEQSIQGKNVFLLGDNEAGKSSFLQAVFSTLSNQHIPADPITHGKDKAELKIDFVIDGREYTAIRRFTKANPRGYFELKAPDGMTSNSVSLLENIVGEISFNPFEFVELSNSAPGRKKQVEFIKKLIPEDDLNYINQIEKTIQEHFEARTEKNRDLKYLSGKVHELDEEEINKYKDPIDVDSISNKLEEANEKNNKYNQTQNSIESLKQREKDVAERIKNLNKQLKEQQELKKSVIANRKKGEGILESLENVDQETIDELKLKLSTSNEHNEKHLNIKNALKSKKEFEECSKEIESLTEKIENSRIEKSKAIKNSKLPVEGLEFSEDEILINGYQLSEDQISTSKIMEIGVQIQKALNPKLKICKIPRGESLGKNRLEAIKKFAKENSYQLFIEKVDITKDKLTINLFED